MKLLDYTPEEMTYRLDLAAELKTKKKKGIPVDTLRGKNVALIFEKTSTRTRCSFEVAAHDLGMGTTYLCLLYTSRAEAEKEKMIKEAEGQAAAILKVQQANADGLRFLKEVGVDEAVIQLKSLEAFAKAADGQATKIIIPVSYTHLDVYKRQEERLLKGKRRNVDEYF